MIRNAIVKSTKEPLKVYKLAGVDDKGRAQWHDYDNMGAHQPPKATRANKKVFTEDELQLDSEVS